MKWNIFVNNKTFEGSTDIGKCYHDGRIFVNSDFLYRYDVHVKKCEVLKGKKRAGSLAERFNLFFVNAGSDYIDYEKMSPEERFFDVLNHELFHAVHHKKFETVEKLVPIVFAVVEAIYVLKYVLSEIGLLALVVLSALSMCIAFLCEGNVISIHEVMADRGTPKDVRNKSINAKLWFKANL